VWVLIEILSVGMTQHGYRTEVEYLPQGPYPLEEVGRKPAARIVLRSDKEMRADPLTDQIPMRQTNRRAYAGAMLTEQRSRRSVNSCPTAHLSCWPVTERTPCSHCSTSSTGRWRPEFGHSVLVLRSLTWGDALAMSGFRQ
jgi:hypothetical protein